MSVTGAVQAAREQKCSNWMNAITNSAYHEFLLARYPDLFKSAEDTRSYIDNMVLDTANVAHYNLFCYKLDGKCEGPFEARHARSNELLAIGMYSSGRPTGTWILLEGEAAVVDCTDKVDPRVAELDVFTTEF